MEQNKNSGNNISENINKKNEIGYINNNKGLSKIEEEQSIIDASFSINYSDVIGKDLFKEDLELLNKQNTNNETVLEQKINKEIKKDGNLKRLPSSFIQSKEINIIEKSLNISILDSKNINNKENEYLSVRKFSTYNIEEYENVRKKVLKDLYVINSYLLEQISCKYNEYNINRPVGPLLPLTTLIESAYNYKSEKQNLMNQKYLRLKNKICNYRTIFGDGNCFYRAVMFRYIELLILNKKSDYLKLLIIDIYKCFENEEVIKRLIYNKHKINPQLIVQIMIIIMELVENNDIIRAHQTFYKALLASKFFDFSLILYFRFILYDYIKKNEKKYYLEQFPVLIGNLLPSIYEKDGVFDFNSFYNNYLLKMFVYAEKIIIYLTPFVLGINLDVVLFDDNENEILKHFIFVGEDILKIKEAIYVINKIGHYENVYNYDDNKNFNDIYQYYRKDVITKYINIDPKLSKIYALIKNLKTDRNQEIKNNNNKNQDSPNKKKHINKDNANGNDKNIMNNNYLIKKEDTINENKNNIDNNIDNNIIIDINKNGNNNIDNNIIYNKNNTNINNTVMKNNFFGENKKAQIELNKNNLNVKQIPKSYRNVNPRNKNFYANQQNYFNFYTVNTNNTNNNAYNKNNILKEDSKYKTIYKGNNQILNNNINNNEKVSTNNNELNMQNKCIICSSGNKNLCKNLGNICQECLFKEIKNQSKTFYIKYLEEMNQKINEVTVNDLNNRFINKIEIYIGNKAFNIHKIFEELHKINLKTDKNQYLRYLFEYLKSYICLYCFKAIKNNNSQFKMPCGCNFCCRDHLEYFFKYIVINSLTYNYKCLCAYQYKPSKVLELCILLNNNKIYHNNKNYADHLESIFSNICCKCSGTGKELIDISVDENFIFNFTHKICFICFNLEKNNNNKTIDCIICNKKHQYMPVVDSI